MKNFLEFVEEKKKSMEPMSSRTSLGDGNDFQPFVISDDPNSQSFGKNSGLAPVVKAFKRGGNWGWSKDDKSGEDKPVKISGRKLFLVGGALRDHLLGKRPRNMELATNASSDEVFQILKQNNFKFTGEQDGDGDLTFWVDQKSQKGRPFKFGLRVKHDTFELSIFTKTPKGTMLDPEAGSQTEDAAGRDFTINAMSLLLSNENGPNKDLQDFYGGLHHLKSGRIQPIGDMSMKFQEDPLRILRFARMLCRYGDPSTVLDNEKEGIRNLAGSLMNSDRSKVIDEFMRIFSYHDGDIRSFLKIYDELGILDYLFPNLVLDKNIPPDLRETGDKIMPLAWMVRHHMPEEIEQGFEGFDPNIVRKIIFMVKSLGMNEGIDPDNLSDIHGKFLHSGVSTHSLKKWAKKAAEHPEIVEAFIEYARKPRISYYVGKGSNEVNEQFADLVDPFTGTLDFYKAEERKKNLEHQNFLKLLRKD